MHHGSGSCFRSGCFCLENRPENTPQGASGPQPAAWTLGQLVNSCVIQVSHSNFCQVSSHGYFGHEVNQSLCCALNLIWLIVSITVTPLTPKSPFTASVSQSPVTSHGGSKEQVGIFRKKSNFLILHVLSCELKSYTIRLHPVMEHEPSL